MSSRIEIYVPTVDGDGQVLPLEISYRWRDHVAYTLTEWFGGCTCLQAMGYYRNSKANIVMEQVEILYSYTSDKLATEHADSIRELAKRICVGLRQECVLIVNNGTVEFVNKE